MRSASLRVGHSVARLTFCIAAMMTAGSAFAAADLIPLSGPADTFTHGRGVSADGFTVVGFHTTAAGSGPFRWTAATGTVNIGTGGGAPTAWATSGDGSVVVGEGLPTIGGFRWTSADGVVPLAGTRRAREVSADGNVVVGNTLGLPSQAFRWTQATGVVGIGNFPGGSGSDAFDVSDDGNVIVGRGISTNGQEAFRWTEATGIVGLGDLPGGDFTSEATGVSADGSVIVGGATSADGKEAFRWTAATGIVSIGGGTSAEANAVSDDGNVIVGRSSDLGAFYWTPAGGMQSLWDVLLANGVNPALDGWTSFSVANHVSADGTHITGGGTRNGVSEAFLAIVPEPNCVSALVLTAALARRRRR